MEEYQMQRESWSIAFACALGAFIGGLVAQSLGGQYLWTLGALVGGVVAYVAIDFKQFCAGIVRAYEKTAGWQPYVLYWKAFGSAVVMIGALCASFTTLGILIAVYIHLGKNDSMHQILSTCLVLVIGWLVSTIVLGVFFGFLEHVRGDFEVPYDYKGRLRHSVETNLMLAGYVNPVSATYWLCYGLVKLLYHSPSLISKAAKFLGRFTYVTFVYMHSARRTICFVDASIGAAIGFMCSTGITGVLIGTVVGAILGVVNYEIVSIRWLKIVPTR